MALVMRVLGGLLLWAAGFSLLYAVHGLGCGLGWGGRAMLGPLTVLNMILIPIWLLLLAVAAWLIRSTIRTGDETERSVLRRAGLIGAWAGLAGLLFTGAPVLLPAHCM